MRICHFIDHLDGGGGQSVVLDLVSNLNDDTTHVVWYLTGPEVMKPDFEAEGVETKCIGAQSPYDPHAIVRLIRHFRRESFDLVHTHTPFAQLVARILKQLGVISTIVSTYHMMPASWYAKLPIRWTERATRRLDDTIVAVSNGVRRAFGGDSEDWRVIHNGIDVDKYHRRSKVASSSESDGITFVNIGRFVQEKGQLTLVRAMEQVVTECPDATLYLLGGGELRDRLQREVRNLDLQDSVVIKGRVSVYQYYGLADVFVFPSLHEGHPLVVLEAMAARLPVVASNIPGVNEVVVDGETGVLVPPADAESLAEAMMTMESASLRRRLATNGFERVKTRFDVSTMVRSYSEVYQMLNNRQSS